jgi:hypothetical protein
MALKHVGLGSLAEIEQSVYKDCERHLRRCSACGIGSLHVAVGPLVLDEFNNQPALFKAVTTGCNYCPDGDWVIYWAPVSGAVLPCDEPLVVNAETTKH